MLLVLLNVVAVVVESEHQLYEAYQVYFDGFEIFSVAVFTLEYGLRLWVCVESSDKALQHPLRGRWRYVYSPMALIDLLAILPFYPQLLFWGIGLAGITQFAFITFVKIDALLAFAGLIIDCYQARGRHADFCVIDFMHPDYVSGNRYVLAGRACAAGSIWQYSACLVVVDGKRGNRWLR